MNGPRAESGLSSFEQIRRDGLRAASQLVDMMCAPLGSAGRPLFGTDHPDRGSDETGATDPATGAFDLRTLRADADRAIDAWAEIARRLVDTSAEMMSRGLSANGRPFETEHVTIGPVAPAETAGAEIWIHNTSQSDRTAIRLHCGDLRHPDGGAFTASAITFDPPEIPSLPARSSRGVRLQCVVPGGAPPGRYVAVVMATNLADVFLPIVVIVEDVNS